MRKVTPSVHHQVRGAPRRCVVALQVSWALMQLLTRLCATRVGEMCSMY
jgi:hypothetical protein